MATASPWPPLLSSRCTPCAADSCHASWLSPAAIAAWEPDGAGTRGAQRKYSDLAIESALTLRLLFHLPLRRAEGFLTSLFVLRGLDLRSPDQTTLSRRGQHLDLTLRGVPRRAGLHLFMEEDVTLPSASASRERLLPVQGDHWRWSSSQDTRWANGQSAARMQHTECDDRPGPARLLRHRPVKYWWLGSWRPVSIRAPTSTSSLVRGPSRLGMKSGWVA